MRSSPSGQVVAESPLHGGQPEPEDQPPVSESALVALGAAAAQRTIRPRARPMTSDNREKVKDFIIQSPFFSAG